MLITVQNKFLDFLNVEVSGFGLAQFLQKSICVGRYIRNSKKLRFTAMSAGGQAAEVADSWLIVGNLGMRDCKCTSNAPYISV